MEFQRNFARMGCATFDFYCAIIKAITKATKYKKPIMKCYTKRAQTLR